MPANEDRSILALPSRAPDREMSYGNDPLHVADVWESQPAPGGALVLLIHGGFWRPAFDRKHLGPLANAIADAGFTVASIEYRREPGAPDLTTQDVALACATLPRALSSPLNRAIVIGHSAGGHLALWSASMVANSSLAFVALAPVASLEMAESLKLGSEATLAFLGTNAATRRDLDPLECSSPTASVTIIHGIDDEIVPRALSERYLQQHPRTRLITLTDIGHFAVIDPRSAAWPVLLNEIRRHAV